MELEKSVMVLVLALSPLCCTGRRDELSSSGVPCYLHPAADGCHYTLRPGSDVCTSAPEKKRLSAGILVVNRTLTSLEQQLIRLGIIPADDACSELPPVDNGGIVYSDLSLAPGISARYVCDVGFNLRPFYERYNFTCTEDGIWDGNVTEVPVECQLSAERCDSPEDVLNGNISYSNGDSANTLVGDVISYSCDPGTKLHGPAQRFCLRTGNWSGLEPECIVEDIHGDEPISGQHRKEAIGAGVGSAIALLLVAIVVTLLVVGYKCRSQLKRKLTGHEPIANLEVNDAIDGSSAGNSNVDVKYKSPGPKKSSQRSYRSTQTFDDINL